ncbi:hypothetical protein DICVIV_12104 [Dictyocaulus viviparus]|uniref:Uncharacterized protein n=1 Tax=Dictyocaulus viviparus TaxID=29172 RepID=A0A0D8XHV5_DICVI|nr:hypothetical protein DICVIV_12104 [Dictyocaulus viviparus]
MTLELVSDVPLLVNGAQEKFTVALSCGRVRYFVVFPPVTGPYHKLYALNKGRSRGISRN